VDLRQAVAAGRRGSPEFLDQLEGRGAPEDALGKADAAVSELYQARSKDYSRRMNRLKQNPETLDFTDVLDAVDGVRNVGRHKGIDVSGAGGVWDEVDAKIAEFESQGLNSIEDFDAMKQSVSNIARKYPRGTPENRVASQVAKAINKTITDKAPVYASVMNDYRVASDTLSDIKASISADAKSADTTLLKLRRSAGGTGPRGRKVIDLLESTPSGRGLGDLLAGQNLAAAQPSLFGSTLSTGAAAITGDPTTMLASALSARALGRDAYRLGVAGGKIGEVGDKIMQVPGVQRVADLAARYADPLQQGIRVANPALIQPQVDPVEITQPDDLETLVRAYNVAPPEMMPAGSRPMAPGAPIKLEDFAAPAAPVTLEDFAAPAAKLPPSVSLGDVKDTYYDVDELGRRIDPVTGLPIEEEEVVGMQRGGMVQGYNRGGTALRDRARSVGQGVTFGFGDELEGGVRALGRAIREGDLMALRQKYLQERDMVRAQQKAYEDANPIESLLYEGGGAMLTGLVPGAQGATAARMAQLAARSPKAARAAAVAADTALYGAGSAESVRDIPRSIRDEALFAVPMYGGAEGVRMGVKKYKGRKKK
jgi:hypothetical protein